MSVDRTQEQSPADEQRSKNLSLQRTQPPTEVPGYELQRLVGQGAYGEVWQGLDRNTGRKVAIKFYAHRRGVDWSLLAREVEKLVFLSADRYVVQLLDVGWNAEPPYYVMEFVENGSLDDLLRTHGPLPPHEAIELFREIAIGLAHAHGKGVLHCDLKPANILLDEDSRPRLADFGQSRLTTEQRPALGTLFYMAPEQADLDAVPDVRWDVYGLGAILYCLLVGVPPHRSDGSVSQLETANDLSTRLARYRQVICDAPQLTEHRRVRGVDKLMGDIIDRCLATDPRKRFANVQEVLDALSAREEQRQRRPLILLGMLGPLLFIAVMALFGWRGYQNAMNDAEAIARAQAAERNRGTAELAAQNVYIELVKYFDIARREADRGVFHGKLAVLKGNPLLSRLNNPKTSEADRVQLIRDFTEDPARRDLNKYLEQRLKNYLDALRVTPQAPKFASLLVLDKQGTMIAAGYDSEEVQSQSVGRNFVYRTYFHGGPADLPKTTAPGSVPPVDHTHLSSVFQSSSTKLWRVAVTTPIPEAEGLHDAGYVMVFTINLGDFQFMRGTDSKVAGSRNADEAPPIFPVLVDGRGGQLAGTILQHPLFNRVINDIGYLPERMSSLRVPLDFRGQIADTLYKDPLAEDELGSRYAGDWLASSARVPRIELPTDDPTRSQKNDTGLIVLVQERYSLIAEPVRKLGNRLVSEGLRAVAVLVLVSLLLWYVVIRWIKATPAAVRRRILRVADSLSDAPPAGPPHALTTMAATQKKE